MSYVTAKGNFAENVQLVGSNPMSDPQNWNLNHGLFELTKSVQSDVAQLNKKLDETLVLLRRR